jgi:threonine/homoserine/homoserine lactone efflux protein
MSFLTLLSPLSTVATGITLPSDLWGYCVAAFFIIIAPGPAVLFTIARAISWGRKIAVLTVLGNVLGAFTLSCVVAVGLGPLITHSLPLYIAIQLMGGFYLIYLGIGAIKDSRIAASAITDEKELDINLMPSIRRAMWDGFWVGALNPKGIVFFAAILPSFVDRSKGGVTSQLIVMGAIFAIMALFSDGSWGLLAGTLREWLSTEISRLQKLRIVGGSVMIALGIFTIVSGLRHL